MNQILVTKRIYVTPELRRRKKIYKIEFFICVILACLLFSYYVYAEYDRGRSEEVSQEILASIKGWEEEPEDTTIKKVQSDDVIVVALDDNEEPLPQEQIESHTVTTEDGIDYNVEATLTIPSLDISYPVITETSEELLKISINKYWGGAPNTVGNYCVVGHNYKSGKMFGNLSEIVNDDIIELEDMNGNTVKYAVYNKFVVEPTDTSCTSQLTNGRREITLITCTNYGQERLVVKAREIK